MSVANATAQYMAVQPELAYHCDEGLQPSRKMRVRMVSQLTAG